MRVCPRCGSPADESRFCGDCGLNLAVQSEAPTRAQWEARHTESASGEQCISATGSNPATTEDVFQAAPERNAGPEHPGRPRKLWIGVAAAAVSIIVVLVLLSANGQGFSKEGFDRLQPGDTAATVEETLGQPDAIEKDAQGVLDGWSYCTSDANYRVYIDEDNLVGFDYDYPQGKAVDSLSDGDDLSGCGG